MRISPRLLIRGFRTVLRQDFFASIDCQCVQERFGSAYGGWVVAPRLLSAESIIYSFGVGEDASFEIALIKRFGARVHAFDPTPKSIAWVARQQFPPLFVFHPYGLADFDGEVYFAPPENQNHVSYTTLSRPKTDALRVAGKVRCLSTIMQDLGHGQIDVLKMDIEGSEYSVIECLAESKIRPRQILLELHHRFPEVGVAKSKEAISQIRSMGYHLFSISETGEEFSFIKIGALGE